MQYFPKQIEVVTKFGLTLSLQAEMAWDLLRQNTAIIAGTDGGEDSAGRQKVRMQEPVELVARVFAIVDAFVATAEARNDLQIDTVTNDQRLESEP
jgi:hypothetical protein